MDDIAYSIHDFEDYYRAGLIRTEFILLVILAHEIATGLDVASAEALRELIPPEQMDQADEIINQSGLLDRDIDSHLSNLVSDILEVFPKPPEGRARDIALDFPGRSVWEDSDDLNRRITKWRSDQVRELIEATSIGETDDGYPSLQVGSVSRGVVDGLKSYTKSTRHQCKRSKAGVLKSSRFSLSTLQESWHLGAGTTAMPG